MKKNQLDRNGHTAKLKRRRVLKKRRRRVKGLTRQLQANGSFSYETK